MSMFDIIRAQGVGAREAVEPGMAVMITEGDRVVCDQPFTEVYSITRIDNNLHIIVTDNPPTIFNQFFSAQNTIIQFTDKQISSDELNKLLTVHLSSTDLYSNEHQISLLPGSFIVAQVGDNFYLDTKEFNVKNLHRHGEDLLIQSHDETPKTITKLSGFFTKPEAGMALPQLHIVDPAAGTTQEMIVHPHSNIFQWEGEPLPTAVVGSLYGYYFQLQGADADKFILVAKTADGELPSWMTFSHVEHGKYYLGGIPTTDAVGTHEIFIQAYSTQNNIGFHTQQSFELMIKSTDDTTTRSAVDSIATAEFRSLNEVLIAESYVTGVLSVDQMPYMSLPEIAVITGLSAINPVVLNQMFSTYATADQISHAGMLGTEAMLGGAQALEIDLIRNQLLAGEGFGNTGSHIFMGTNIVETAAGAEGTQTTEVAQSTQTASAPTQVDEYMVMSGGEAITPAITPYSMFMEFQLNPTLVPFALYNNTVTHSYLLTLTPPPAPPPPSGPLFIDLGQPYNGFEFDGQTFAFSGRSATIVTDMTGDGLGDLVVGAFVGSNYGNVYLIPGRVATFPSQFNITDGSVNGSNFSSSVSSYFYNYKVADVSDYNGDGLSDLLIVTQNTNNVAYVVFGNPAGFPSNVDLNTYISSGGATEFTATPPPFSSGTYITNGAYLGDVNGDGLADIILSNFSRSFFTTYSAAHVIFGTNTPPTTFDITTVNGINGFNINPGAVHASYHGMTGVDINGDGFNDVFYNIYGGTPYNNEISVVFGRSTGFPATLNPTALPVGQGFIIHDSAVNDTFYNGFGVRDSANIGDVNHDGIDDVLIVEKNHGNAYVIFGSPNFSTVSTFDVATLNGTNGFKLTSSNYDYITQVAYVGDVNGDGLPDFGVIDAFAYSGKGAVHIIFGSANPFPAVIDLHNLARNQGFTIIGTDSFAGLYSVGGGGDINGDGLSDIVVSGWLINSRQGASYVIFGGNFDNVITLMGTSASETLNGTGGNDVIYGAGGNDIINALGGNDFISALGNSRIYAGQGNDTIVYYRDDAPVQGGTGTDTLWFKYDNTHVTFIGATNYTGIDEINLQPMRSLVGNSVTLDAATVLTMSDANLMTITGNAHDILTLIATDFWTATSTIPGYTTYTSMSGSVVNVQDAVHVTFAPPAAPIHLNYTLSSLVDGVHGFSLTSTADFSAVNATIMQNGDGFGDLLIGSHRNFSTTNYINAVQIHGQASFNASTPVVDLSLPESSFKNDTVNSPQNFYIIHPVAVSDFNGDGINDFLLSSFYGYPSILVLGQASGFPTNVPISDLGSSAVTLINTLGNYNNTAAALGDVNGDGLSDIIISNSRGSWSAVIFGTQTPETSIDTALLNGTDGFVINRVNSYVSLNFQDVGGGDISGDGLNDIFVSFWDQTTQQAGVGVILGNNAAFNPTVTVGIGGITGASGFIITDSTATPGFSDRLVSPTNIGDFNGNGIDDIALSSQDKVYVIFGDTSLASATTFDLATFNGTNGFTLVGAGSDNITGIAYLGDVNGDGLPDFGFVDSAAYAGAGAVYVIFGTHGAIPATINITTLTSDQGFVITDPSINLSNASLGGGGDINGDGLSDISITSGGTVYTVFGNNFNGAITQMGTANETVIQGVGSNDVIYAVSADHTIIGGTGFTFIDSGTGHDIINGGTGMNTIVYSALDISVDAGIGGPNTLWLENDGIMADLQNTTIFKDFDVIDLRPLQSLKGNEVDLNPLGVSNMSHNNTLQVEGGAHDFLVLHNDGADVWSVAATNVNIGGFLYTQYTSAVTNSTVYAENTLNHVSVV